MKPKKKKTLRTKEQEETLKEIKKTSKNDPEAALQMISKQMKDSNTTPANSMGIPKEALEGFYSHAYNYYNQGKYTEAANFFRLLIILDSTEYKYALGYAATLHMQKDYTQATNMYFIAALLDPKVPTPFYHAADCYMKAKNSEGAMDALERAIAIAGNQTEFLILKQRSNLTLKALKEQQSKGTSKKSQKKEKPE